MKDTPRKLNRRRVSRCRNKFKINEMLKNVEERDGIDIRSHPEKAFATGVKNKIKKLIKNARRSQKSQIEASKYLLELTLTKCCSEIGSLKNST